MKRFRITFYDNKDNIISCHWKECENIWYALNYIYEIKGLYEDIVNVVVVAPDDEV